MKNLFLLMILFAFPANAQIYNMPGGLYPKCEQVTTCINGVCTTATVCR